MIYELAVVLKPDLGQELTEKKIRDLASLISRFEGEIKKEEAFREIVFAYPIKKYKRGFLGVSYFTLKDPRFAQKIDLELDSDESLLRHIIVKRKEIPKSDAEILAEKQTAKLKKEASFVEQLPKDKEKKSIRKTAQSKLKKNVEHQDNTKSKLEEIDKKIEEILESEIK